MKLKNDHFMIKNCGNNDLFNHFLISLVLGIRKRLTYAFAHLVPTRHY